MFSAGIDVGVIRFSSSTSVEQCVVGLRGDTHGTNADVSTEGLGDRLLPGAAPDADTLAGRHSMMCFPVPCYHDATSRNTA